MLANRCGCGPAAREIRDGAYVRCLRCGDARRLEDEFEAAAREALGQFVSHPPHGPSFLGGFMVGAMWAEDRLRQLDAAAAVSPPPPRAASVEVRRGDEWDGALLDGGD
jgi:hypothetical protein